MSIITTQNLGLVAAIQASTTPPTNIQMLWYDTNIGQNKQKYYDVISATWIALAAAAISSINGLTATTQLFIVGTAGSDFNIVSSGNTHIWNSPIASSINTGKLLNTDWILFNNKENSVNKSTDTTLSANSDILFPTQKAVKTYIDGSIVGLLDDRGSYDASSNLYPSTGGSGTSGAILKGDLWYISVSGTLGSTPVLIGYSVRALVNSPGQTIGNWDILQVGLGYVPENVINKSTDGTLSANSDTLYSSQKAVKTYIASITASMITGSGTMNKIPMWNSSSVLTNSSGIVDGGTGLISINYDTVSFFDSTGTNLLMQLNSGLSFIQNDTTQFLDSTGTNILLQVTGAETDLNSDTFTINSSLSSTPYVLINSTGVTSYQNVLIGSGSISSLGLTSPGPVPSYGIQIVGQLTTPDSSFEDSNSVAGLFIGVDVDAGLGSSTSVFGINSEIIYSNVTAGSVIGARIKTVLSSHGNITAGHFTGQNIQMSTISNQTGTVADASWLSLGTPVWTGSKPTSTIGIKIPNLGVAGVTTNTAIQISSQANATNNYAITVAGGFSGFGTTSPTSLIHINGSGGLKYVTGTQAVGKYLSTDVNGVADWSVLALTIGSTAVNSGTTGGILYQLGSSLGQDSSNFFYDSTNHRLGLGLGVSPTVSATIHAKGSGSTSSTYTAQFHNSTGTSNTLILRDDGCVGIGTLTPSTSYLLHVAGGSLSGIVATSTLTGIVGVGTTANSIGVQGQAQMNGGHAIDGLGTGGNSSTRGIYGAATVGVGVEGIASSGIGGIFSSTSGYGLIVPANGGNVGFGTSTPSDFLHISLPSSTYGGITIQGDLPLFTFKNVAGNAISQIGRVFNGSTYFQASGANGQDRWTFYSKTNNDEFFTISAQQNEVDIIANTYATVGSQLQSSGLMKFKSGYWNGTQNMYNTTSNIQQIAIDTAGHFRLDIGSVFSVINNLTIRYQDGNQGVGKILADDGSGTGIAKWITFNGGVSAYNHTIFTPTTGGTVNLVNNQYNIINPAGALLALTVNLPSSPSNNDVVYIKFTQTVSTVTYANGTVVDGITAPTAGGLTVLVYDSGTTSWY